MGQKLKKGEDRMSNRTRQNNKRADRKMESKDSPEILGRWETSAEEPPFGPLNWMHACRCAVGCFAHCMAASRSTKVPSLDTTHLSVPCAYLSISVWTNILSVCSTAFPR